MSRYVPADFYLLRSPALPVETFLEFMQDADRTSDELLRLARAPEVRRAIAVASEDLAEGLERLDRMSPKSVARVHSRLWRYLTRMSTRPTPFGAFSGVAAGTFSGRTTARLGSPAITSVRVRADMGWILACIKQFEDDPATWRGLRIVRNATAHVSGDRMVLPHADVYGKSDRTSVRVRATPAVHAVLDAARTPVTYSEIIDALSAAFPEAAGPAKENLVQQLWDLNFLTSDLRPPQTSARPELYLLDRLTGIPQAADAAERLREIVELIRHADDPASLSALRAAQEKLVPGYTGQTYQLDSAIDLRSAELNRSVADAAADTVDVLMRLSAATGGGNAHLAQYREEFLERYGQGVRVPVLELLSPDQGLDAPLSYTEPPRTAGAPGNTSPEDTSSYDRAVVEFARQAWSDGSLQVELTDSWLDRLAPDASVGPLLPVMDVYLQIEAADRQAVDRGEWRAVVRADGLAHGGRTFGRFFDLLGDRLVDRLRELARREEELQPHVAYAELAYLPTYGRAGNVAAHPGLRSYEIPVNTSPSASADHVLPLDDILVGADEGRFHLWSRRLDREVVVTQHHMLSPLAAPNVARFLLEASQDGYVMPGGFHWGPVSHATFLPRVTRGKVVLRPAEWRLDSHGLEDLAAWRERWNVPRHVYLVEHDNRLLLDLDHPRCADELREETRRKGGAAVLLHEMLPDFANHWLSDDSGRRYTEEIVVPVIAARPETVARSGAGRQVEIPSRRYVPGSEWSYVKLYAAFERHDEIIAGPLRELVAELRAEDAVDRWFYIRYADPRPHLRIRVRSDRPWMLGRIGTWGKGVVDSGLAQDLAMDSYCPETMRYGGPDTFDAVERLFEANSDATAQLIAQRPEMTDMGDEHLAVAAVDTLYRQWGIPLAERMDLLPGHADDSGTRDDFKKARDYLCELLLPWDRFTHETGREHRLRIAEALAPQESMVRAASAAVRQAVERDRLAVPSAHVIGSLAHMQVNRLLSVDLAREERCYGLLRHTLRTLRGRLAAEEGK
ncbi:thiopeptide-type bacteriocin biosynthesis domain protein [Streptomyces montanus]|uniref:Thiopeptide-type bacteriocin biosynthesis domain protein n=1 Tax=Streptomyces montanus TaxID=2580423 RepID=A0A5R9FQL3_9ACTN|nr:lantibiotic dehydratase [Streptomyces montanus]TLS43718.1 thiopeptide-type bacteriocin biosynthesis domain protein [Streptomyces montanus]